MNTSISNIEDVKEFFRMYLVTSIKHDYLDFKAYNDHAESHCGRMIECRDFCISNNHSYHDIINEIKQEVKGQKIVSLKVYINSVDDVRKYFRWIAETFPIKYEYDTDECKLTMDYHRLCSKECSNFCYENDLNFWEIHGEVSQEIWDEKVVQMRELWFELFPHYRTEAA